MAITWELKMKQGQGQGKEVRALIFQKALKTKGQKLDKKLNQLWIQTFKLDLQKLNFMKRIE